MTDQDLENLLARTKDSAQPDDGFKRALNFKLNAEINKLNNNHYPKENYFMKRFTMVLGGAVVTAVALAVIFVNVQKPGTGLIGKQQITYAGKRAFGSLTNVTTANATGTGGGGGNASAAPTTATTDTSKMAFGMGGGTGVASPESLIYRPTNYKFVYKGDEFTVDDTTS